MLCALLLLQWAASALAFCPQAWGRPRASSPSPLALPRVPAAPQANDIKITSFKSAEARAAVRREAAQPPLPPPDLEAQAVPQQANPPSVPMPHAVQPPVPQQPPMPQQPPEPPPGDPAAAAAQATAQAASQAAAAQAAADRLTVQLAVDAAAAAAAAVLRSGAGDVSGATVTSI